MRNIIKKLAINLAFFQLFSSSIAKSENNNELILINDNINNPIYQRYNTETNEYENISIFDECNASLRQYGANQIVFQSHFNSLIQDPIIEDEMRKYFPEKDFDSKEIAHLFYKYYFQTISDCGCGYAAATNYIFRLFEGREEEFYKKFGFPMYEVDLHYIDFNYEIIMLKFFNYYMKSSNTLNTIKKATLRKVYEYKLDEYTNKKDKHKKTFKEMKNWTIEEYKSWKELDDLYVSKISYYKEKLKSIPEDNRKYSIPLGKTFGNLKEFLSLYGIIINSYLKDTSKNANSDEILASENYTLYENNFYGLEGYDYEGTGPHYLYISDVTDDGEIIVSSWGKMYIFDNQKSTWTKRITFKGKIDK